MVSHDGDEWTEVGSIATVFTSDPVTRHATFAPSVNVRVSAAFTPTRFGIDVLDLGWDTAVARQTGRSIGHHTVADWAYDRYRITIEESP